MRFSSILGLSGLLCAAASGCGPTPGVPPPPTPLLTSGYMPGTTNRAANDPIEMVVRSEGPFFDSAAQSLVRSAVRLVRWPALQSVEISPIREPTDEVVQAAIHIHTFRLMPRDVLQPGWYAVVANRASLGRTQPAPHSTVELAEMGLVAFPFRVGSAPRVLRVDQCLPRSLGVRVNVLFSESVTLGSDRSNGISLESGGVPLACTLAGSGVLSRYTFDCPSLREDQDLTVRVGESVCSPSGPCMQQGIAPGSAEFSLTRTSTVTIESGCRSLVARIEVP